MKINNTLPPAIADLCGILLGEPRRTAIQSEPRANAVELIEDDENSWTLTHNGDAIGWINKVKITNREEAKYRTVSVHGETKLCHSLNHAKAWLQEESA